MPAAVLGGDRGELWRELLGGGLSIASSQSCRNKLADFLSGVRVEKRARAVERVGWHTLDGSLVFVLPNRTFGGGDRVFLQSERRVRTPYRVEGSAAQWRDEIGVLCAGNSRLVLKASTALSGPLLHLSGERGGGFHFYGPSTIGKSVAELVAGSVWGGGEINGFCISWRATSNGLEGVAAEHCDTYLPLDEMGEVSPQEAASTVYMLANGTGKQRATRSGAAARPHEWRVVVGSNGEITLADKMSEIGRRPRAGQEVRLIDVPADAGAGYGLFEALHGQPTAAVFADRLKAMARRFYGAPSQLFLECLTERMAADQAALVSDIQTRRNAFLSKHQPERASPQVRTVCARFALTAVAGELATEFGVTGWPKGEATAAAARCFEDWLARRGGAGDSEIEHGIRQVIAFIEAHGSSRFEAPWESGNPAERIINRVGFRKRDEAGVWEYMILPEAWRGDVCKGFDATAIARAMRERRMLDRSEDGKHLARRVLVPGHGKPRLYCLALSYTEETGHRHSESDGAIRKADADPAAGTHGPVPDADDAGDDITVDVSTPGYSKFGGNGGNSRNLRGNQAENQFPPSQEQVGTSGNRARSRAASSHGSHQKTACGNLETPSVSAGVPTVPTGSHQKQETPNSFSPNPVPADPDGGADNDPPWLRGEPELPPPDRSKRGGRIDL
jgi:uncharacterized protein (DUF927 family)